MLIQAIKHFLRHDGLDAASVLSFQTVLALVPTLFLSMSLFSLSPLLADYQILVEQFLFAQLLPEKYTQAQDYINIFIVKTSNLTGASVLFLLVTAVLLLFKIDQSINRFWSIRWHRSWLNRLLSYLVILFVGPLLILVSLLISAYILALDIWRLQTILAPWMPFLLSVLSFTLIYYFVPMSTVSLSSALKAGIIATILLESFKFLIVFFVEHFARYDIIYGAFAIVPLMLIWLFLYWLTLLLGASLTYCFDDSSGTK